MAPVPPFWDICQWQNFPGNLNTWPNTSSKRFFLLIFLQPKKIVQKSMMLHWCCLLIDFAIRCHRKKHLSTSIKYRRFQEKYKYPCALFIAKHCYFPNSELKKSKSTIRENFTFFSEKKFFKFGIHVHRWKKIAKKIFNFFPHTKIAKKKFAISKISNKKFRKINYFANIKYKRNLRKYCEKNLRRNIFVKRKIFAKKIR